jgi:hypothetical protein
MSESLKSRREYESLLKQVQTARAQPDYPKGRKASAFRPGIQGRQLSRPQVDEIASCHCYTADSPHIN